MIFENFLLDFIDVISVLDFGLNQGDMSLCIDILQTPYKCIHYINVFSCL